MTGVDSLDESWDKEPFSGLLRTEKQEKDTHFYSVQTVGGMHVIKIAMNSSTRLYSMIHF